MYVCVYTLPPRMYSLLSVGDPDLFSRCRCLNADYAHHRDILIQRLVDGGLPRATVKLVVARVERPRCTGAGSSNKLHAWFPLPFHPWWHKTLQKSLRAINRDDSMRALLRGAYAPWRNLFLAPAWSNSMPNLSRFLSRSRRLDSSHD